MRKKTREKFEKNNGRKYPKSAYKGVYQIGPTKWRALVVYHSEDLGKQVFILEPFYNELEAAEAYEDFLEEQKRAEYARKKGLI